MKDRIASLLPPPARLWTGLSLALALFLMDDLVIKALMLIPLLVYMILGGRRPKPLLYLTLLGSVLVFQLLSPSGRVLAKLGPWEITADALSRGLDRGMTLVGLMFISFGSIGRNLKDSLPRKSLPAATFYYFSRFMDSRDSLGKGRFMERLDDLLFSLYQDDRP